MLSYYQLLKKNNKKSLGEKIGNSVNFNDEITPNAF